MHVTASEAELILVTQRVRYASLEVTVRQAQLSRMANQYSSRGVSCYRGAMLHGVMLEYEVVATYDAYISINARS